MSVSQEPQDPTTARVAAALERIAAALERVPWLPPTTITTTAPTTTPPPTWPGQQMDCGCPTENYICMNSACPRAARVTC